MWFEESVIYQIYPFGFFGAPEINDGKEMHRILEFEKFIPHIKKLNVTAVYFCPVFESRMHGYDTTDFTKIDTRLGNNEDFKVICDILHKEGIKVILDGVFNHVGRDFFAFKDLREHKWNSRYKDWFIVNFDGNSSYDDGFWYEGWEGHYELVKLNLDNYEVKEYLLSCVGKWIDEFDIDGLRLDVAYMLNRQFMKELRSFCLAKKSDFFLAGEMIHGNYKDIVNSEMLHSATNYECFKGIHSSLNSINMFEIGHSMRNRFGNDDWCMYRDLKLINFVDNHDVTRIASNLKNEKHITLAYGILFSMPGIPCIYYGSEWGIKGEKIQGTDAPLRPHISKAEENEITAFVTKAAQAHKNCKALCYGNLEILHLTNKQIVYQRQFEDERVIILINADCEEYIAHYNANAGRGTDLMSGEEYDFGTGSKMPPYSVQYIKIN